MPTVIDSLVVTLGLDAAKFTTGQRTAREDLTKTRQNANTAAKEISASGAQAAQFFGKLRNEALSLAAVFVGGMGLKSLVQNINTADAATGRLSRNLGISTETLTTWGAVIERAGGSATEAATTFSNLTRAYQEYQATGQTAITPYLQRLGINNPSELKDIPALLMKIGDTIERERMSPQQANFLMAGAGLDEGMRNFLLMSRQRREASLAESAALGAARKKDTDAAEALEAAFLKTKQAIMDVGRSILTEISGPLQDALKAVNLWLSSDENRKWLRLEIEAIGVSIRSFLRDVDAIVQAIGGWKTATEILFGLWVGTKFLGVIGSLTRILTLMAAIPGSGVTASALAALGIAALPLATKSDTADNQQANEAAEAARQGPEALKAWQDAHPNMGQRFWNYIRGAVGGGAGGGFRSEAEPAAPYQAGSILGQVGINAGQYDAFKGGVADVEHARYNQMGGSSGRFAGRYQFGSAEIAETARRLFEPVPSQAQFLGDPAMQERYMEAYSAAHHSQLMAQSPEYRAMTPAQRLEVLGYAHNQGVGGAVAWLKTGQVGRDAFRTKGTDYNEAVRRRLAGAGGAPGAGYRPLTREETTGLPPMFTPPPGSTLPPPTLIPPPGSTIPMPPGPLSSNQSETHIGQIAIHTQATDANGIARGIGPALSRFGLVAQANTGLA